jgi:DNA/RNA non-specific endonuclease
VDEPAGIYTAAVDPVISEAVLITGDVCFSGGSTDSQNLTAKAHCLNQVPADSYAAGTGWIENTTTPVNNINITTTPNGPGTRASVSTACLTNPRALTGTGPGSNPTGYADATAFVKANGYNPATDLVHCHLIAQAMGGRGIQANLFPCWQVGANTGAGSMATPYESDVLNAIPNLANNEAVYYQVTVNYFDNSSTIPYDIVLTVEIRHTDGTSTPLPDFPGVVDNSPTANPLLNMGN